MKTQVISLDGNQTQKILPNGILVTILHGGYSGEEVKAISAKCEEILDGIKK